MAGTGDHGDGRRDGEDLSDPLRHSRRDVGVLAAPHELDRAGESCERVVVCRLALLSDRTNEHAAHHSARRPVVGGAVALPRLLETPGREEVSTHESLHEAVLDRRTPGRRSADEGGGIERRCREEEAGNPVRHRGGETDRHPAPEGVTDEDDRVGKGGEDSRNRLGVLPRAPLALRRGRRTEAREVEGDRGQGALGKWEVPRHPQLLVAGHARKNRRKVPVIPPPAVQRQHHRRFRAVDLAEEPAAVEGGQHAEHPIRRPAAGPGTHAPDTSVRYRGGVMTVASQVRPPDLLAGCDSEQAKAITTAARPLCVLAGAGSGKTRVLTRRIAWRVQDGSALAGHVLALTFTRKAAAELRTRLKALGVPEAVTAGTFHAIALAELRRFALERGQPAPVVLPSKAALVHRVLETRPLGRRGTSSRGIVHEIAGEIEWAKARLVSPSNYPDEAERARRDPPLRLADVASVYEGYERARRKERRLDFEDLLTVCASAIASDVEFAESARWRFRHLFVDEYQDVNAAQLRLLKAWCGGNDDICVVGDPDQAIYGWNGSDPKAITRFGEHFPGATVLRLKTNYRSTGEVLQVAAGVLGSLEAAPAGGPVPEGPIPSLKSYDSDGDEAAGVAELTRLAHRPGRTWSQIAVLARTNAQLTAFRHAFEARGIPCRVLGESEFLRRDHVANRIREIEKTCDEASLSAVAHDLRTGQGDEGGDDETLDERARDDLVELAALVEEYLSTDQNASGAGFRAFLQTNAHGLSGHSVDAVEVMTFHRAKGLEWPVVFVTGLEEGLVPIAHARDESALEEERRLLYVACTRAEEELHCSWARQRRFSGERPVGREPSRHLEAIERSRKRLLGSPGHSADLARRALEASRRALGVTTVSDQR